MSQLIQISMGVKLMNSIFILNSIIIAGILLSAILVFFLEDTLQCVIATAVLGSLLAIEFLMLKAPDVALAEAAVGAILTPIIFVVALKKISPKEKGDNNK